MVYFFATSRRLRHLASGAPRHGYRSDGGATPMRSTMKATKAAFITGLARLAVLGIHSGAYAQQPPPPPEQAQGQPQPNGAQPGEYPPGYGPPPGYQQPPPGYGSPAPRYYYPPPPPPRYGRRSAYYPPPPP